MHISILHLLIIRNALVKFIYLFLNRLMSALQNKWPERWLHSRKSSIINCLFDIGFNSFFYECRETSLIYLWEKNWIVCLWDLFKTWPVHNFFLWRLHKSKCIFRKSCRTYFLPKKRTRVYEPTFSLFFFTIPRVLCKVW